jgi:hypothetical protein
MPPSTTSGSPYIVSSKFTMPTWSSPHPNRLDTPKTPAIRSTRALNFRGFTGLQLLRPVRLLASPRRIRLGHDPAAGDFYVQAFDGAVTLPAAGYDYDIDWTPLSAGLAPAGMAASFAALGWVELFRETHQLRERKLTGIAPAFALRAAASLHPSYELVGVMHVAATKEVVILRESGGSSKPRLLGFITDLSDYWVARSSRATTAGDVATDDALRRPRLLCVFP